MTVRYLTVTCMLVFCPGVTKTNSRPKVKKKLFLNASSSPQSFSSSTQMSSKSSIACPKLKDVAVSMTKLSCSSTEKSSRRAGAGKTAWEEGFDFMGKDPKGVTKEKGSKVGWAAGKGGWEGEKDDWGGGGWEKGKAGWGRGRAKGGWRVGKVQKKKSSLMDGLDNDTSSDFVPLKKRTYAKITQSTSVYTQPDQKRRGTDCCIRTHILATSSIGYMLAGSVGYWGQISSNSST